ncbi:MAG: hypothetical protein LBV60_00215, partial [Streptomyces sp.]|nr:hypothetical protein [Streptomyces sp.]
MSLGDGASGGGDDEYGGVGQTRTRLPDRGGDVYGGARRGRSSSRKLVTVVGVVVFLIAAIAFANRGGDDSSSGGGGRPDDKAASAPTAASGTQPVRTKTQGIPSGFAHDEQGAQSAASNYAVALGSTGMFEADQRHTIVTAVYAPEVAAARQTDLDKAYSGKEFLANIGLDKDGKAPAGETFVSRIIPVGTKVTK